MKQKDRAVLISKREKEVIRLEKRVKELWAAERGIPLIPLEKPIRDGWVRHFVLRPDNINPKLRPMLNDLLKVLDNNVFCKNRKFLEKDWKTRKIRPILQTLTDLDEKRYNELDEKYKKYFQIVWKKLYYRSGLVKRYVFKYPDYYIFRIRPSYITHTQQTNGAIKAEEHRINEKLWNRDFFAMKYGNYSRGSDWYNDKIKRKRQLALKDLEEQVEEVRNEN